MLVRDAAYEVLRRHGLDTIFGNPGSNELPFLTGMPDPFRYVLGLHEGAVVGMADGYAQVTRRPVLVNLHSASGTGNAMGALTNAAYARTPLVVTAGQQVRSAIGTEALLSNMDSIRLATPLVGWAAEPSCASDVPRSLAQAIFEAGLRRRPTYLSVPYDDWAAEADPDVGWVFDRVVRRAAHPAPADVEALVADLRAARSPALVVGGDLDTDGLFDEVTTLAERLNAPTWAAPSVFRLGFPNRHPLFQGVLPAGIAPIADALAGHDLVLVLGAPVFRYHEHRPGERLRAGTRLVQVTDDAGAAARAVAGEALVTDPGAVIRGLLTAFPGDRPPPAYTIPPEPLSGNGTALHPEEVFAALRHTQHPDTSYVVESTSTNAAWWRQMDLRRDGSYFFPASGGLGFGIPAAVGVALAQPDRPVVGVIGDGSANYGITGLWTAAQWQLPVTYLVLRNGVYGALEWFADMLGTPDVPGTGLPGMDFTQIAEGYGVPATHANDLAGLRALLAEPTTGPRLIQVDTVRTSPA